MFHNIFNYDNDEDDYSTNLKFKCHSVKKPRGEFESDARASTDEKGRFSIKILKGQKGILYGSMITFVGEYENCPKLDKLIRSKGTSVEDIETPALEIEAVNNLSGVELKFPFPSCRKAKIE